jgi:hypothetical protein
MAARTEAPVLPVVEELRSLVAEAFSLMRGGPLYRLQLLLGAASPGNVEAANVRFLIALPLLILSEVAIDRRLRITVSHFLKSGLVKEPDLPSFEAVIERITGLHDRVLPEILILAVALPAVSVHSQLGDSDEQRPFMAFDSSALRRNAELGRLVVWSHQRARLPFPQKFDAKVGSHEAAQKRDTSRKFSHSVSRRYLGNSFAIVRGMSERP